MSIQQRLEDAQFLYENGRREGALLSVLIAVAATARRRYPRPIKDQDAFQRFVGEEMQTITRAATGGTGSVRNINVNYLGRMLPLQKVLYKYVRCELAHEAGLPESVEFDPAPGFRISVSEDKVVLSDGFIVGLSQAVIHARENSDLFGAEVSPDGP